MTGGHKVKGTFPNLHNATLILPMNIGSHTSGLQTFIICRATAISQEFILDQVSQHHILVKDFIKDIVDC